MGFNNEIYIASILVINCYKMSALKEYSLGSIVGYSNYLLALRKSSPVINSSVLYFKEEKAQKCRNILVLLYLVP